MSKLQNEYHKLEVERGALVEPLKAILEHLINEESGKEYIFKTNDETEFSYAFHGIDFLLSLWDLDEFLRGKIKYSQDLNEDAKTGLQMARDELREILHSRDLSLEMLR